MNRSDNPISDSLKYLAEAAPQEAPRRVGANLQAAFRRHHIVRKRMRTVMFTGLAASLMISVVLLKNSRLGPSPAGRDSIASTSPKPTAQGSATSEVSPLPGSNALPQPTQSHKGSRASGAGRFVLMPGVDPDTPTGSLIVVRVELPTSSLSLVGLPSSGDGNSDRVLADVLLDQDGTPYAIRMANGSE